MVPNCRLCTLDVTQCEQCEPQHVYNDHTGSCEGTSNENGFTDSNVLTGRWLRHTAILPNSTVVIPIIEPVFLFLYVFFFLTALPDNCAQAINNQCSRCNRGWYLYLTEDDASCNGM